jgi:hypothetical protein
MQSCHFDEVKTISLLRFTVVLNYEVIISSVSYLMITYGANKMVPLSAASVLHTVIYFFIKI